jgi:hypothetical protein
MPTASPFLILQTQLEHLLREFLSPLRNVAFLAETETMPLIKSTGHLESFETPQIDSGVVSALAEPNSPIEECFSDSGSLEIWDHDEPSQAGTMPSRLASVYGRGPCEHSISRRHPETVSAFLKLTDELR